MSDSNVSIVVVGALPFRLEKERSAVAIFARGDKRSSVFISMEGTMGDVSVVGLGSMGSALARALVGSGRAVTVWNRTGAKADLLVAEGAEAASTITHAVEASPVVIVCVDNYAVARSIFEADDAARSLAGRVMVQLSTGRPQEARDSEKWAQELGFEYLDGALMCYPQHIATDDAVILLSGSAVAFQRSESILKALAHNLTYLGAKVGAASALDLAMWSFGFGAIAGAIHGARMCESEGIAVDEYSAMIAEVLLPVLEGEIRHLGQNIQEDRFEEPTAALRLYVAAAARMVEQAAEGQINAEVPRFLSGFFSKGMAAGYGQAEVGAMIKVLRET